MTSMPSSPRRLDRMTASGPCSDLTRARAARMLGAVYLLIFMQPPYQFQTLAAHRRNHADAAVFRNLVIGKHRERRRGMAHQARDPRANLRGDQQHSGFTRGVLASRAVAQRGLNPVRQTRLESRRSIDAAG